jgi:hypothetical protein
MALWPAWERCLGNPCIVSAFCTGRGSDRKVLRLSADSDFADTASSERLESILGNPNLIDLLHKNLYWIYLPHNGFRAL